jgi:hypothetical protein
MKIITKIEFEFDTNDIERDLYNTVEDLQEYAKSCMVDDIYNMVKYNELNEAIKVTTIGELI